MQHSYWHLLSWIALISIAQALDSSLSPEATAGDSSDAAVRERYGIPLVSGLYGIGSWAAWILVVTATLVDKLFVTEKDTPENNAHIWGADLNLAGAFAYPVIASIDILANMHRYFDDDVVVEQDMARMDAPLVALREGIVLGSFILVARSLSSTASKHRSPRLSLWFSALFLIYLLAVNNVYELRYCRF